MRKQKLTLTGSGEALSAALAAFMSAESNEPVTVAPVEQAPQPVQEKAPQSVQEQPAPVAQEQQQSVQEQAPQPAAEQTTRTTGDASIGLDSNGIAWDSRIHAGSKKQLNDGSWRRRKNTPDELYNSVIAELKAEQAPPAPQGDAPVQQQQPVQQITTMMPMPAGDAPVQQPVQQPVHQMPMFAGDAPVQQQAPENVTFDVLMNTVSVGINAKTITPDTLGEIAKEIGVGAITDVATSPELIIKAYNALKARGA